MNIGTVLDVFLRPAEDDAGAPAPARIGSGLVLDSEVVQLDEPAAALLRSTIYPAGRLELRDQTGQSQSIARVRPGLLTLSQTAEIVAARLDGLQLLQVDGELVFLEVSPGGRDSDCGDDGDQPPVADPWYCRFICTSSCSNC